MNRETVIESYILKMSIETRASSSHARMFIYELLEMLDRADNPAKLTGDELKVLETLKKKSQIRDEIIETLQAQDPSPEGFKWIGRNAIVGGEDFTYVGHVLCSFPKTSGKVRYVVEDNSRLFIQREAQIKYTDVDEAGNPLKPWKGV